MRTAALVEIEVPHCYRGKPDRFNDWRRATAEMTGVRLTYRESEMPVGLRPRLPAAAPPGLPVIVADIRSAPLASLTSERRLGYWPELPEEPLWIVLALTVPGGVVQHRFASAIAERLGEITELMYGIDDGRFGTVDLGRMTRSLQDGMKRIAREETDAIVQGGYEPGGWWTFTE